MRADTSIWPTMVRLAECLCAELEQGREDGDPELCFCGVLPGSNVIADYAGSGVMGYVRLDNSYPTSSFPDPEAEARCATFWAHTLEVGVMECISVFSDSRGAPPTKEQQYDYTERQVAALAAMIRAISCCLDANGVEYVIGAYTPVGPAGDIYGGNISVTVLGA